MSKWVRSVRGSLVVTLMAGLLAAGCGSAGPSGGTQPAAAPNSTDAASARAEIDVTKQESLKVAYSASVPNLQDIQLFVAQEKGIYTKYGLKVEIVTINGAAPTLQALVSGDTDVAFLDPTHLLLSQEKAQNLKAIVNTSPTQPYMLLARGSVKDLKDLSGKRIGISQAGTLSQSIVQLALEKFGVPDTGIQWVPVGGSGPRYQALVANRIDAGIAQVSHSIKGEQEKEPLKVLADLGKELPDLMGYLYVAKQSTIEQKRSAVIKFAAANLEATRLILKDKEAAAESYMQHNKGLNKPDVLKEYDILKGAGAWNPEGDLKASAITFTSNMMIKENQLKAAPKMEQIFAPEILEAAKRAASQVGGNG
jgi:NitT/TauT family transport system substrate-binding protein